nr:hypothetical protein [Magnetospirillum aberrantis]
MENQALPTTGQQQGNQLFLYSLFHLNLSFSSIEEDRRKDVVRRCYWPLLRLAELPGVRIAIEASGYTLETIAAIDPSWCGALRRLIDDGRVEFVGSGYVQMIGPLVPPEMTLANLSFGAEVYRTLLGRQPDVALVNEQAYAPGLVPLYRQAGYGALVVDWANPFSHHPDWPGTLLYLPRQAMGEDGATIDILWSDTVGFQKFQRYAHDQMDMDELLHFLETHRRHGAHSFPLYANDAEIFDFRPGRFSTEPPPDDSEWHRITQLYQTLAADPRFHLALPRDVLALRDQSGGATPLQLETADGPVPVKKQPKYNLMRWAVTGRDDLEVNTLCWRAFEALRRRPDAPDEWWRELCFLWSSDFRTHITERRWQAFRDQLERFVLKLGAAAPAPLCPSTVPNAPTPSVQQHKRHLDIETASLKVRLNPRRGLAIESCGKPGEAWLFGTLSHGFYEHIAFGADFYSGHTVMECAGGRKLTDLDPVTPEIEIRGGSVIVRSVVDSDDHSIAKTLTVHGDRACLDLEIEITCDLPSPSQVRMASVTLNPDAFDRTTLTYAAHNGGRKAERHSLAGQVDLSRPPTFNVSASTCLGLTGGTLEIADRNHRIVVTAPRAVAAVAGLVTCVDVRPSYFCRAVFTGHEHDDTSQRGTTRWTARRFAFRIEIQ